MERSASQVISLPANGTEARHIEPDGVVLQEPSRSGSQQDPCTENSSLYHHDGFLRGVFGNPRIGVILFDPDGHVLDINQAALGMLDGATRELVRDRGFLAMIGRRHQPAFKALLAQVRTGESCHLEFEFMSLKGRRRTIGTCASPLPDPACRTTNVLALTHDNTGAREGRSTADRLHAHLINAREKDQARIAREIHDNYGQQLAHIAFRIQDAANHIPRNHAGLIGTLEDLWSDTRRLSSELLQLSYEFSPMKLRQLGLQGALRSLCKQSFDRYHLPVHFVCQNLPGEIDDELALGLYRIAQEAFGNMWAHSKSTDAVMELYGETGAINLIIDDFGIGFDCSEQQPGAGFGLERMRERAQLLGGQFSVNSKRGEGVSISVSVPLERTRSGTEPLEELRLAEA